MNGQLVLLSHNLSSITPGMELKEVCFPSQPAFPKCPLQTNPCAISSLMDSSENKAILARSTRPLRGKCWFGSLKLALSHWIVNTFLSFYTVHPDLLVYRSVSLVHSTLLVSLRQLLYFVRFYTHIHTWFAYSKCNSGFFLQLDFLKLIQPKQQSQVSWVAGKTGK